jgi:hypothetical protein
LHQLTPHRGPSGKLPRTPFFMHGIVAYSETMLPNDDQNAASQCGFDLATTTTANVSISPRASGRT